MVNTLNIRALGFLTHLDARKLKGARNCATARLLHY